jgi:hypothetical protein
MTSTELDEYVRKLSALLKELHDSGLDLRDQESVQAELESLIGMAPKHLQLIQKQVIKEVTEHLTRVVN